MTERQLLTRLCRIRDPQKLRNFYRLAWENNSARLIAAAVAHGDEHGIEVRDVRLVPRREQSPYGGRRPSRKPEAKPIPQLSSVRVIRL